MLGAEPSRREANAHTGALERRANARGLVAGQRSAGAPVWCGRAAMQRTTDVRKVIACAIAGTAPLRNALRRKLRAVAMAMARGRTLQVTIICAAVCMCDAAVLLSGVVLC
jgi:hypothetical protein